MITTETGRGYSATRCDLCAGLTKVPRTMAVEWRVRNEPNRSR